MTINIYFPAEEVRGAADRIFNEVWGERARVNQLVSAENEERKRLYKEIARANGFPKKADEVQKVFAETWRDKADKGWYIEQSGGGWERK